MRAGNRCDDLLVCGAKGTRVTRQRRVSRLVHIVLWDGDADRLSRRVPCWVGVRAVNGAVCPHRMLPRENAMRERGERPPGIIGTVSVGTTISYISIVISPTAENYVFRGPWPDNRKLCNERGTQDGT